MPPDRAFLRVLAQAEREMDGVFGQLAHDLGDLVLRSAGPDGIIPVERLRNIQDVALQLVDAAIGGSGGRGFDDRNQAQSPYAKVIQRGQEGMVDLELGRQAQLLSKLLPEELRLELVARLARGGLA